MDIVVQEKGENCGYWSNNNNSYQQSQNKMLPLFIFTENMKCIYYFEQVNCEFNGLHQESSFEMTLTSKIFCFFMLRCILKDCVSISLKKYTQKKIFFWIFFLLIYIVEIFKNIVPKGFFGIPNIYGDIAILVTQLVRQPLWTKNFKRVFLETTFFELAPVIEPAVLNRFW